MAGNPPTTTNILEEKVNPPTNPPSTHPNACMGVTKGLTKVVGIADDEGTKIRLLLHRPPPQ